MNEKINTVPQCSSFSVRSLWLTIRRIKIHYETVAENANVPRFATSAVVMFEINVYLGEYDRSLLVCVSENNEMASHKQDAERCVDRRRQRTCFPIGIASN